jgi:hypothetical protein
MFTFELILGKKLKPVVNFIYTLMFVAVFCAFDHYYILLNSQFFLFKTCPHACDTM